MNHRPQESSRPTYQELEQQLAEAHQLIAALRSGEADAIITELEVALLHARKIEAALRQSEENFRHSLEESPLGIRIVNAEGETLYANPALKGSVPVNRLLGVSSGITPALIPLRRFGSQPEVPHYSLSHQPAWSLPTL
jgi:hypothetical protein